MIDIEAIHYSIEASNVIIASIFFLAFALIVKAVYENKRNTGRPVSGLAILLAAIFITCGSGHIAHLFAIHSGNNAFPLTLGPVTYAWLIADAATAAVSIAFIIMRKNAGIVIDGPYAIMETKDKLRIRNEQMQALHKITQAADNTLDLDEMTRNVLLTSSVLMDMKGGGIYLIDRNQQPSRLVLAASSDPSLFANHIELRGTVAITNDNNSTVDNNSALEKVIRTKQVFIAHDKAEVLSSGVSVRYAESLIILPLKKNELVGVFMLFDTKPRSFIPEEITFLEAMSTQIGNAIEKASLYKNVVESHRQMTEAKQQSDLLADLMSHDIRNYEQIAQGNLDLVLMDESLSQETREYVQKAYEASQGTTRIIDNVKKLGRLGKYKDIQNEVSLTDIVERIEKCAEVIKAANAHTKKKIEISISSRAYNLKSRTYQEEQVIEVPADEFIDDIFLNLLSNAVKYSDPYDNTIKIDVTVERSQSSVLISIVDYGRGIPEDRKQAIFQRYTMTSSGSGLGLSICKAVVERYKGKIWVENRVANDYSKGSVFKIELPLAGPPSPLQAASKPMLENEVLKG